MASQRLGHMNRFTMAAFHALLLVASLLSGTAIAGSQQPPTAVQSDDGSANAGGSPEMEKTMSTDKAVVLVVGASGSIGVPTVAEAFRRGYETRALVRNPAQAKLFPKGVQVVVGDLTQAETLHEAVEGVTGIIFTHGIGGNDPKGAEQVNYGAVRNVLSVLEAPARIALMTAVGVTKPSVGHDWKRPSCAPADYLTPSYGLDGLTTTLPINSAWYCGKAIRTGQALLPMVWLPVLKSPRSLLPR